MFGLKKYTLAAVAALGLSVAGGAQAATCSVSDVVLSTACIGANPVSGSPSASDIAGLGGFSDWSQVEKLDVDTSVTGTSFKLTKPDGSTFNDGDDQKMGLWELINPIVGKTYALTLKGGTEFAAYILSGTSGTWTTSALTAGGSKPQTSALSNAVLFSRDTDPPGGVIPVPAGLPLLLTALGLGGLVARRKRKSA